jgi:hypothetical protein
MSWFSRWIGKVDHRRDAAEDRASATASTAAPAPRVSAEIERLISVGAPDGVSVEEALVTLRQLRSSPEEATALDELMRRAVVGPLPEPITVALASTLVDRGEPALALKMLSSASSSPALMLSADLRGAQGDVPGALALAERVLLRDLDYPGARDRHRRWRTALGLDEIARRADPAATTVATSRPESPFLLLREVARGGAGAVYEADDRELGRKVALKVYHQPERDRAQLLHEARVAAELSGPGIVRVFDLDPQQGWLALEWAPLGALRDHVRARTLEGLVPLEKWALPLSSALAHVHTAGWVHHDVKPANVLLYAFDSPTFGDFGTARRAGGPSPPGSLGYVSPERMAGRASDPRDDVYGFGRILEDVTEALGDAAVTSRWRPLILACIGADEGRPADGRALATRIRVE